jgi:hypothetical protein
MNIFNLLSFVLFSVVLILPVKVSLANEEIPENGDAVENIELEDFTKDGDSLEGIESRDVSDNFWNLEEGEYHEKPSNPHLSPNTDVQIQMNENNQPINNPLNQTPSDDKTDKLNSNYGDTKPTGGKIPVFNF